MKDILEDIINDVRNMSIEEYNAYHKEALTMRKAVLCSSCLCCSCIRWVDCGIRENKPWGFCLARDLFTYTAYAECNEYVKGKPIMEEEFDNLL